MSRPLLPAPRKEDEQVTPTTSRPVFLKPSTKGRTHVAIACNSCRKSKSKCDGLRPACTKCARGKKECVYVAQADAMSPQVLKRKHRQLEERTRDLEDMLEYLCRLPLMQANEVLRRLRSGEDPQGLVRLLRDSHVLLQLSYQTASPNGSGDSLESPPTSISETTSSRAVCSADAFKG